MLFKAQNTSMVTDPFMQSCLFSLRKIPENIYCVLVTLAVAGNGDEESFLHIFYKEGDSVPTNVNYNSNFK